MPYCANPKCEAMELVPIDIESTWTMKKMYCPNPKCGRVYNVPTMIGKIAQVTGFAMVGTFALVATNSLMGIFGGDDSSAHTDCCGYDNDFGNIDVGDVGGGFGI